MSNLLHLGIVVNDMSYFNTVYLFRYTTDSFAYSYYTYIKNKTFPAIIYNIIIYILYGKGTYVITITFLLTFLYQYDTIWNLIALTCIIKIMYFYIKKELTC